MEYHKPEYHVNIEIYIDNKLDSKTTLHATDTLSIQDVESLIEDQLKAKESALSLGSALNDLIGTEKSL